MKNKRYLRTVVCFALGAILLTGSALANYDNASGYTKLKNGVLSMKTVENFTAEAKLSLSYNGSIIEAGEVELMYDRNGTVTQYKKETTARGDFHTWTQDGYGVSKTYEEDVDYTYSVYNAYDKGFNDGYLSDTNGNKKMEDDTYNFLELLCDTMVGDLKNNFVLVSSEDGTSTYQISLNRDQIPELIQSGLAVSFGRMSNVNNYLVEFESGDYNSYGEDEWQRLHEEADKILENHDYAGVAYVKQDGSIDYYASVRDYMAEIGCENLSASYLRYMVEDGPSVDNVSCTVAIDSEGRITDMKASAALTGKDGNGDEQTVSMDLSAKIYDYGTTAIEPFDTSIFKGDWNQEYLNKYGTAFFDADGNKISFEANVEGDNIIRVTDENGNVISESGEIISPEASEAGE